MMNKLNIESIDLGFKEVLRNYSCLALASRASERILSLFMGPRKKTKYFRLLQKRVLKFVKFRCKFLQKTDLSD